MSRRRMRIYLFSFILLALAAGTVYYIYGIEEEQITAEGTLI